jgi:hypothetical protein
MSRLTDDGPFKDYSKCAICKTTLIKENNGKLRCFKCNLYQGD